LKGRFQQRVERAMGAGLKRLDLEGLRHDIVLKADELQAEAARLEASKPDDAAMLRRIADRLMVYMHEYLQA
jgi:hypothetical protein